MVSSVWFSRFIYHFRKLLMCLAVGLYIGLLACGGEVTVGVKGCEECPEKCLRTAQGVGSCVPCLEDKHCRTEAGSTRICNNEYRCICGSDADCPQEQRCLGKQGCVQCKTDSDCKTEDRPFCVINRCSVCKPNSIQACAPKGKEICAKGTQTCRTTGIWQECKEFVACKESEKCSKGACVPDCPEPAPCKPGERKCSTDASSVPGRYLTCTKNKRGCYDFATTENDCGNNEYCAKGQCQKYNCPPPPCQVGQTRCVDAQHTQSCVRNKLGCAEWKAGQKTACPKGQQCRSVLGKCAACAPKSKQSCYPGQPKTLDVGICKAGQRICKDDGSGYGACTNAILPSKESCNGKDDDCDGKVDNNLKAPACNQQQGACKGSVRRCGGSKGWLACEASDFKKNNPGYQPKETLCDGLDNNCNGTVDEGYPQLGKPCSAGSGACQLTGKYICGPNRDKTECSVKAPRQPGPEKCDGIDNDCNGRVDDGLKPLKCAKGDGVCATAVRRCGGSKGWLACDASDYRKASAKYESPEVSCDGLDNDCDGKVDNNLKAPACTNQKGVCQGSTRRCGGSKGWLACEATDYKRSPSYESPETLCDGQDNDCDGQVDESLTRTCYSGPSGTVGKGPCKAGSQTCTNGSWPACKGQLLPKPQEVCGNGIDDNCDGKTEENCSWALSVGSSAALPQLNSSLEPTDMARDSRGNTYITGSFLNSTSLGEINLVSKGKRDIFLAKMDATGRFVWAISAGGNENDTSFAVKIGPKGFVYLTGAFDKDMSFAGRRLTGNKDGFIAKLDPQGKLLWFQGIQANGFEKGQDLAIDPKGQTVYVTGEFSQPLQIGSNQLLSKNIEDIFVGAWSTATGQAQWGMSFGTPSSEKAGSIAVDSNGQVYVAGSFSGTIKVGAFSLKGYLDFFVARIDPGTKKVIWAKSAGGNGADHAYRLVSSKNYLYLTGYYTGPARFGNTSLASYGGLDVFVSQLDNRNGSFVWTVRGGSRSDDAGRGLALDPQGNVYVTGNIRNGATFNKQQLRSQGFSDIFVMKLSSVGLFQWAVSAGATRFDEGRGIVIARNGSIHTTGYFEGAATFGSFRLQSSGQRSLYLAQLDQNDGQFLSVTTNGGLFGDTGYALTLDSKNQALVVGSFSETGIFGTAGQRAQAAQDLFLFQADALGQVRWSLAAGGKGDDRAYAITHDGKNTAYITGFFSEQSKFGTLSPTVQGLQDVFVASVDLTQRKWSWVVSAGGKDQDTGRALVLDTASHALYVAGHYYEKAQFGGTSLASRGESDLFVAALDLKTKRWGWAKSEGGTGQERVQSMQRDSKGGLLVLATYDGTTQIGSTRHNAQGYRDILLTRFDPRTRAFTWSISLGGLQDDRAIAMAQDKQGDIYLTGCFSGRVNFGKSILVSQGNSDIFVLKIKATTRTVEWAVSLGNKGSDCGHGIALDSQGQVYVTGHYHRTLSVNTTKITSTGYSEIFLARLSSKGQWNWLSSAGGSGVDRAHALLYSPLGLFVTGSFHNTATFSKTIKLKSRGGQDAFLWKQSTP